MISVSMIITAVIVVFILILLFSGYLKAPPDVAYIISGIRKKPRILVGKAGIRRNDFCRR